MGIFFLSQGMLIELQPRQFLPDVRSRFVRTQRMLVQQGSLQRIGEKFGKHVGADHWPFHVIASDYQRFFVIKRKVDIYPFTVYK